MPDALFPNHAALDSLCRRHHIRRLSLFGSGLKGTARDDSDVDLLVEFEPRLEPGLIALAGIETDLSALPGGKRVALRTAQDLGPHFREEVWKTATEEIPSPVARVRVPSVSEAGEGARVRAPYDSFSGARPALSRVPPSPRPSPASGRGGNSLIPSHNEKNLS